MSFASDITALSHDHRHGEKAFTVRSPACVVPHNIVPEDGLQQVTTLLRQHIRHPVPNSVYLGISGLGNMDMIAASGSQYAILMDASSPHVIAMEQITQLIRSEPRRSALAEALASHPQLIRQDHIGSRSPEQYQAFFEQAMANTDSWLGNDGLYTRIHEMVADNRLATILNNMFNTDFYEALAAYFTTHDLEVHMLYLDNAPGMAESPSHPAFLAGQNKIELALNGRLPDAASGFRYRSSQ